MKTLWIRRRTRRKGCLAITDPGLRRQLEFMNLTEEDLGLIAEFEPVARACSDRMVDEFYDHILRHRTTREILERHTTVERQRPRLTAYVLTMFGGRIDDAYVRLRQHVGTLHDDIDLGSTWYIAMYRIIRRTIAEELRRRRTSRTLQLEFSEAFTKLVEVDIALVIQALMDSRQRKILALREESEGQADRLRQFVRNMGEVLNRIAQRDLSARMEGDYSGEFAAVRDALNTAVGQLADALGQVSLAAEQVAAAATQISSGSQSLARGASEQAASLSEVSNRLKAVSSLAGENTSGAKQAFALSEAARESVAGGVESMHRLSEAVERIKVSADSTARIVKTIDEIAFQTNLLALNAAVEAARAGEAGRGFAVVAEEVRNLATRSAEAARDTADLIEQSVRSAGEGVQINAEVLAKLAEIRGQVDQVGTVTRAIAQSSEQQSLDVGHVTAAVEQLNQITQQTAAHSEQSAGAAQELEAQAQELEAVVRTFRLQHGQPAVHGLGGAGAAVFSSRLPGLPAPALQ